MIRTICLMCLLGPLAAAQDEGQTNIPPGTTYLTTAKGVKAIDRRPAPAVQAPRKAANTTALPAPLEDTFDLHSSTSATKVIYLDFDGHDGFEGNYTAFNFEGTAGVFSDAERTRIQRVWQSVAEDFLPFEVDVTTRDPGVEALRKNGRGDTHWGIRVVITDSVWDYSWAYVDSFNDKDDYEAVAYAVPNSWIWIADSISHEVGHALGLNHDGGGGDGEYYEGHGSGATFWAPIMGWTRTAQPYGVGLSHWSEGNYNGADNTEDDLAEITSQNGFGYRLDDHGSSTASATAISITSDPPVFLDEGIIEKNTDLDFFAFALTSGGELQVSIRPDSLAPNLDILARIHDASGTVLHTSNPSEALDAEFNVTLPAGDYYLSLQGTGFGNPPTDGYSDYGSLGYYCISGSFTGPELSDYDAWAATYPGAYLNDPNVDLDGDQLTNWQELAWGLDPTSNSSLNPITLDLAAGTFSYTRRDPTLTGMNYTVWSSTDLLTWTEDAGAIQTPGGPADGVETVVVTLSRTLLSGTRLFVRMGVE